MTIKLLRHPIPYEYESLMNYFWRLVRENCTEVGWLLSALSLNGVTNLSSLNRISSHKAVSVLADAASLSLSDIINMTVNKYSLGLWKSDGVNPGNNDYYYNRFVDRQSLKFCPLCLQEKYFQRIYWCLRPIRLCLKHKVILIDKCLKCENTITTDNLISGKCSCGADIRNFEPKICIDNLVIKNQKQVYCSFGINPFGDDTIDSSDDMFYRLEKLEYLRLIDFLEIAVKLRCKLSKNCNNANKPIVDFSLEHIQFIEETLVDWPKSFLLLLEEISELILFGMQENKFCNKPEVVNPLYYLHNPIKRVKGIEFFDNAINAFMRSNCFYTYDFFVKRFKPVLVEDKYISLENAEKILHAHPEIIKANFQINLLGPGKDGRYIELEILLELINSLVSNGTYSCEIIRDNFNIDTTFTKFLKNGIKINELLRLLYRQEVSIKINPCGYGFRTIYVNKKIGKAKNIK